MHYYKQYKQWQRTKKELAENSDTKIEDSHPYIAELVEIMPKYRISEKKYSQFLLGDWIPMM